MHKEPSKFSDLSTVDVHVRRQLWWNLVSLDAQVAFASGLPPIIENRYYEVQPISELADFAQSGSNNGNNQQSPKRVIIRAFVGGRFEFYRNACDFLHLLHNDKVTEADLDELIAIARRNETELGSRRDLITSMLQGGTPSIANDGREIDYGRPTTDCVPASQVLAQFTKMVLSMLAAKPYAVMYGPLRRHGLLTPLRNKVPKYESCCPELY